MAAAADWSNQERPVRYVWLYLAAIAGIELLVARHDHVLALGLCAALLLFFLGLSYFTKGRESDFHVALAVLPLIRVLSLTMPLWWVFPVNQLLLVNLLLVVVTLVAARVLHYSFREALRLNLRLPVLHLLIAGLGLPLGYLAYVAEPSTPSLALPLEHLPSAIGLLVLAALSEELVFRGLLLTTAARLLGPWQGIIFSALAYGVFYLGWQSWPLIALVSLMGLFFGWMVMYTRSLVGVILAHALANITLFIVLPLSVKG